MAKSIREQAVIPFTTKTWLSVRMRLKAPVPPFVRELEAFKLQIREVGTESVHREIESIELSHVHPGW